ncbi:MAG TPA: arginine deiminase-related protein, partial [Saprospiraceae bacterium]|nr:arginine deiminase-related protein [Saprospiraceae bacterium]
MRQITDHIIMIRPKHFGFNAETASNNSFQSDDQSMTVEQISTQAIKEFDAFVYLLESNGIHVDVMEDTDTPLKPDAVFPNNWISTHGDGVVVTYPIRSMTRRAERREDIIEELAHHYKITKRYAFEVFEDQDQYLEGTGSMVLDREYRLVYACLSPRTDIELLDKF